MPELQRPRAADRAIARHRVRARRSRWRGYVGLIIGFFLTILVANWLGLLPGVGTIGVMHVEEGHETLVPFVRAAGADLNFTLGLAIITFVTFVWLGHPRERRDRLPPGAASVEPRYMAPLMFPIHLISELSRLVSLSMRLFGNVFAGEVLIATMIALTPRPCSCCRSRSSCRRSSSGSSDLRRRAGARLRTAHDDVHHHGHRRAPRASIRDEHGEPSRARRSHLHLGPTASA